MPPRAYIHVGAPKCASSLIQGLLNEPDSREIVKPIYLPEVCKVIQSHTPATDFEDYFYRQILDDIKWMIPKTDCLFSVENIFGLMTHKDNCYDVSVKVIDHLWEGFDISVFMYVRRQDTFMESMYNQDVKRGESRSFDGYMSDARPDNLHWDKICEAYSKYDLTVRPFEKTVLETGGDKDFIDALYKWLGESVEIENLPVVNQSLSAEGLSVQKLANEVLSEKQAYDLSMWLEKHAPKKPDEPHDFWDDRGGFLARYAESNRRLFERFMPEFDPSYYVGA